MTENEATHTQLSTASQWWNTLTDAWKQAFNEVVLQRSNTELLGDEMLLTVFNAPNHRFAGPEAPYPNMTFKLTDMSGLVGLPNAAVVVVTFHQLTHIREVVGMEKLQSLFVFGNEITSLEGIESRPELIELYFMENQVESLLPLEDLVNLKNVYCSNNLISELTGISKQHSDTLENFFCLPNPNLKNSTVFAFEQETNIRCRKG
jgi:hypothetical protein